MTLIIAIQNPHNGHITIGSDRRSTIDGFIDPGPSTKIASIPGPPKMVWGLAGPSAVAQALEHRFFWPRSLVRGPEHWLTNLSFDLRTFFSEAGMNNPQPDWELIPALPGDSELLIGLEKHGIYHMNSDGSFVKVSGLFHAIGSSGDFALGYITGRIVEHKDTNEFLSGDPSPLIRYAINHAAQRDAGIESTRRWGFDLITTLPEDES